MLDACHERVERMLGLLVKIRDHVAMHGADGQARDAARDVMRYFDQAGPRHHEDEELHVFPALLAQRDPAVLAVVIRLKHDHAEMGVMWAEVRASLLAMTAAGTDWPGLHERRAPALRCLRRALPPPPAGRKQRGLPRPRAPSSAAKRLQAMSADMMARRGVNL